MQKIPKQLEYLFSKIQQDVPKLLGNNLVGIYLYGSLTYNAFNKSKSDIDCVAVTKKNLNSHEFKVLNKWYAQTSKMNPWVKRLEMTYSTKRDVSERLGQKSESAVYHNSKFRRIVRSDGPNPITWLNIRKSGKVLYGPDPKSFVPNVSKRLLHKALKMEVEYLEERKPKFARAPWDQAYAVLTLCRILFTLKSNDIISKDKAAKWCITVMPEWKELINLSLKYRYSDSIRPNPALQKRIPNFLDVVKGKF